VKTHRRISRYKKEEATMPNERCLTLITAAAVSTSLFACSLDQGRRTVVGGATTKDEQIVDTAAPPPERIYVADYTVEEGAIKQASGLISEGERVLVEERPNLLGGGGPGGGGGILARRTSGDMPTAAGVADTLAASIAEGLNEQKLGFPVERLAPGAPLPSSGWVVNGRFISVDPGNRAERAVVGFGAGEATTEVTTEVDRLGPGTATPVLRLGTQADSGKMPGAAVTMNPYVAAAKFVLGRQATSRDVQAMGKEIAKQIADYARSRRVGTVQ
jgi:hypothetical protein